jgi:hypothetical protein
VLDPNGGDIVAVVELPLSSLPSSLLPLFLSLFLSPSFPLSYLYKSPRAVVQDSEKRRGTVAEGPATRAGSQWR